MDSLEELLKKRKNEYRIYRTEYPGHATEIASSLAGQSGISAVVSVLFIAISPAKIIKKFKKD